jgi:hypothetical protein
MSSISASTFVARPGRSGTTRALLFSLLYWALGALCALMAARWAEAHGPLVVEASQLVRARATGVIYGEQRLGQIVEVPRNGLAAARFWLLAHRRGGGALVLHVAAPGDPARDLARVELPMSELPAQPPVTFALPTFDPARTPVLLLTLEAPELDRAQALSVLGADNFYGGGTLLVNDAPRPAEDLSFQLLSRRLQGDQLLPLTRLSLGRPGISGRPGLYVALLVLVAWACLWMLLVMLRWAWGALQKPHRYTGT